MFIKGSMDNRPGLEAELKVWDKTEEYFCKRESFGFLHFPMFGIDHSLRREIDILVIDRVLGVTVIEVKGISSNQIENIIGSVWYCRKGDETFEISPYAQAERQLDMLCANLEKNPLLYRKFSKRAIVALPYITRKEWEKRGFADMLNSPPILFKDDMENGDWHKKLEKIN
ncbi:MAG: NERD domain-containing protein, partial [Desulfobulbaceae bacterium]